MNIDPVLDRYNCGLVKFTTGRVYDLVIANGWLTKERLDELSKVENMTH